MFNCCRALLYSSVEDRIFHDHLWEGVDNVHLVYRYLNDGDLSFPPTDVRKRLSKLNIGIVIYESEFGERLLETDDFSKEAVLSVVCTRMEEALIATAKKVYGKLQKDPEELISIITSEIEEFRSTFRPEDSLVFQEQPPAPSQKFWLDNSKYEEGQ